MFCGSQNHPQRSRCTALACTLAYSRVQVKAVCDSGSANNIRIDCKLPLDLNGDPLLRSILAAITILHLKIYFFKPASNETGD